MDISIANDKTSTNEYMDCTTETEPTPFTQHKDNYLGESLTVDAEADAGNDVNGPSDEQQAWTGWAELENDPLIFTKLLKDWGVSNIKVDEVIPLDSILEKPADKVLGLIFLSRWTAPDENDGAIELPQHLWFANQISTFSCATLALMNIINNAQNIELGQQIEEFKETTEILSSKEKGKALDRFAFVRDIHNSFSRDLDRKIVDLKLKEDYQAANKKRNSTKKKKRRKRTRDVYEDDEDSGFHFVAYVASRGKVWKLDGMEAHPKLLGSYTGGENWLFATIDDIQKQLEGPEANAMEFSLLSLMREEGVTLDPADEVKVERMKEDWAPFFVHMLKLHAERGDLGELLHL